MTNVIKHILTLVPAMLLAAIIVLVPQLTMPELMNPTQSGKAFGLLAGMLCYVVVALFVAAIKREPLILRITIVDLLLAAFSLMVVVSYWHHPADQLQMLSFVALVVFYLGVRVLDRKYLLLLLVAVAVSGTLQAVYGNLQLWGYFSSHH